MGLLLGFAFIIILLVIIVAARIGLGAASAVGTPNYPEILPASDHDNTTTTALDFPSYDPRYSGIGGEMSKRFELRQVSKTLERHLAVNDQSLRFVKQVEDLEAGKANIITQRFRQRLAPHEHQLRLEEIDVQSQELKARLAQADLATVQALVDIDRLENPTPPVPTPAQPKALTSAQLARQEARTKAAQVAGKLAVLAEIERRERRALAKAKPEDRDFIAEAFRRVKDELREDL
jgi:hypothetical protein